MPAIAFAIRRLLPALLAVVLTMAAAQAQTRSGDRSSVSQGEQSSGPPQPTTIQGVAAELDRSTDRSVHADIQRSTANVTGQGGAGTPARQQGHTAAARCATLWSGPSLTSLLPTERISPSVAPDPSPLTVPLIAEPSKPASPDAPRDAFTLTLKLPTSARTDQQQERQRKQVRESRKHFLQQCSRLGLAVPECRLKRKGQISRSPNTAMPRILNNQSHSQP